MSKLQRKPSALKREYPALQNMKFINFFYFSESFLHSCPRIESGSGSETMVMRLRDREQLVARVCRWWQNVLPYGSLTVNKRAYTTAGTGTKSVAEVLLQSVLPCGSVTVNLRAYMTAGTGTKCKPVAEALLQSVLHFFMHCPLLTWYCPSWWGVRWCRPSPCSAVAPQCLVWPLPQWWNCSAEPPSSPSPTTAVVVNTLLRYRYLVKQIWCWY